MFENNSQLTTIIEVNCDLWNSNIVWTQKLHPSTHQHESEQIMTEFSFLGELSFKATINNTKRCWLE